ncbi:MAG TPA: DUF6542 domain-containing protein [Mycobacteriales bacterium]|nr:DUF6542 domain-containing protein [Mycobacteriales bacterium]
MSTTTADPVGLPAAAEGPVGDVLQHAVPGPPGARARHLLGAATTTARRAALAARPHLVDRRGLTACGATALALLLGTLGGVVDAVRGGGLGTAFGVCFVLGCGAAALAAHREDLRAAVVMPPLAYVVLALGAGAVDGVRLPGSLPTRSALELVNALALGAPVVISATALALVVALGRAVTRR